MTSSARHTPVRPRRRRHVAPWVLLSIGVAAVAVGGGLALAHGGHHRPQSAVSPAHSTTASRGGHRSAPTMPLPWSGSYARQSYGPPWGAFSIDWPALHRDPPSAANAPALDSDEFLLTSSINGNGLMLSVAETLYQSNAAAKHAFLTTAASLHDIDISTRHGVEIGSGGTERMYHSKYVFPVRLYWARNTVWTVLANAGSTKLDEALLAGFQPAAHLSTTAYPLPRRSERPVTSRSSHVGATKSTSAHTKPHRP